MRKKVLIILGILIVITSGLLISVLNMKGKMISYAMPDEEKQSGIVMYVHDGSKYNKSSTVPGSFSHMLNRSKTKCEGRGSIVSYNRSSGTLSYRLPSADMCYVYFDKDTTPPSISSLTLNSGATYTTSRSVTAVFTYPIPEDDWTHYCLTLDSDGSDCTSGSKWQSLNTGATSMSATYTFSADGNQTVYAFIKDYVGNISSPVTDAIIVDRVAPNIPTISSVYSDGSGSYTSGTWTNREVTSTFSSTDSTSGVNRIEYRAKNTTTYNTIGTFSNGSSSDYWTLQTRNDYYFFRACDNAGNCSADSSEFNIKYDYNTAPRFTANPSFSGTSIVFTAVDDHSGVTHACLNASSSSSGCTWVGANNNSQSAVAVNYNTTGTYYIHVKDAMGYVRSQSFSVGTYTVTFAGDGGTPSVSSLSAPQGCTITMPTVTSKTCFAPYGGWNASAGQTSITYSDGGAYALNSNVTLYPVWTNSFTEDFSDDTYECLSNWNGWNEGTNGYFARHSSRQRLEGYPNSAASGWDTVNVYLRLDITHTMTHNRTLSLDWGTDTTSIAMYNSRIRVYGYNSSGGQVSNDILDDCSSCGTEAHGTPTMTLKAGVKYVLQFNDWYPSWYSDSWMWVDNIKIS